MDMEQNTIELYGKVVQWTLMSENTDYAIIKEEGTDKEWEVQIPHDKLHWDLDDSEHFYVRGQMADGELIAEYADRWGRYCDHCGKHHTEGFYSENSGMYFCSEECLRAEYTQEEIDEEMVDDDGNGDLYWTEWE